MVLGGVAQLSRNRWGMCKRLPGAARSLVPQLLLVGGFGASRYLRDRVKAELDAGPLARAAGGAAAAGGGAGTGAQGKARRRAKPQLVEVEHPAAAVVEGRCCWTGPCYSWQRRFECSICAPCSTWYGMPRPSLAQPAVTSLLPNRCLQRPPCQSPKVLPMGNVRYHVRHSALLNAHSDTQALCDSGSSPKASPPAAAALAMAFGRASFVQPSTRSTGGSMATRRNARTPMTARSTQVGVHPSLLSPVPGNCVPRTHTFTLLDAHRVAPALVALPFVCINATNTNTHARHQYSSRH